MNEGSSKRWSTSGRNLAFSRSRLGGPCSTTRDRAKAMAAREIGDKVRVEEIAPKVMR